MKCKTEIITDLDRLKQVFYPYTILQGELYHSIITRYHGIEYCSNRFENISLLDLRMREMSDKINELEQKGSIEITYPETYFLSQHQQYLLSKSNYEKLIQTQ
jgi:hypothetical protein